jgi:hypothetical protein
VSVVFHNDAVRAGDKQIYDSFMRYARQFEMMLGEIKAEGAAAFSR